ncbi:MAG: phosphoglycerate kinase [Flavobacteriales bacterium]|nr:phosphoglycerate kinase [Flavobacteriales bacterium]
MKTIENINFSGLRAIVRVDFNVPLDLDFNVADDTRLRGAIPTIQKITADKGKVILMSHLGRPKNGPEDKFSLKHIVNHLSVLLGQKIHFVTDCIGDKADEAINNLSDGEILLLENLRFYPEEKTGDVDFAKALSAHADVYINDAFGTAHRAHASTSVIAQFFTDKKAFGALMTKEITNLNVLEQNAEKPYTAIIGGAKISGKIDILNELMAKTDNIIIGGGMAFTFIKAMGGKIGDSLVEEDKLELALKTIAKAKELGVNLILPSDAKLADSFSNDAAVEYSKIDEIPDGWLGLDLGEESIKRFKEVIAESKTILWNGPMGVFEFSNYAEGTKQIALAIADSTANGAYSLVGGGDSVAAINHFYLTDKISYVSTGGGALLEYIEGKELPGIKAIND